MLCSYLYTKPLSLFFSNIKEFRDGGSLWECSCVVWSTWTFRKTYVDPKYNIFIYSNKISRNIPVETIFGHRRDPRTYNRAIWTGFNSEAWTEKDYPGYSRQKRCVWFLANWIWKIIDIYTHSSPVTWGNEIKDIYSFWVNNNNTATYEVIIT